MINIEKFDHIGIRITERQRAILFYEALGFKNVGDSKMWMSIERVKYD